MIEKKKRIFNAPKVTIIIVHFYNINLLIDCLKSINNISYTNYEIIVVNNGLQSELSLKDLHEFNGCIAMVIQNPINEGYARGNNMGILRALHDNIDYILLLNDDTILAPDFLDILIEEAEKSPDVGMLGPKIYYFDEPKKIWFAGAIFNWKTCMISFPGTDQFEDKSEDEPFDSDYITGCALLVKKKVIEKIGLLDERFFLYWEDVDWGLRARKAGFTNLVVPNSHIWHKISVSTGGTDSPLKAYHKARSHLYFSKLHTPWVTNKLKRRLLRDIGWLLLKSQNKNRFRSALAYFSAIMDCRLRKEGAGPALLWDIQLRQ